MQQVTTSEPKHSGTLLQSNIDMTTPRIPLTRMPVLNHAIDVFGGSVAPRA
jgi:hypothetical protein